MFFQYKETLNGIICTRQIMVCQRNFNSCYNDAMIFILTSLIVFIIIVLFAFPQFSPIPYFPSNKKDLRLIIKAFNLQNNQTVIDLGAGDGLVIFAAAQEAYKKKLHTNFIAVEINPILILIMHIRKFFHPNRKNIKVMYGNIFNMNFQSLITNHQSLVYYLYISPWYIEKTLINIKNHFDHFSLVSYMYPVKSLAKKEKRIKGNEHDIYKYFI